MATQQRHILLLCDNASSHGIPSIPTEQIHGLNALRLSNVLIVFLPPNTTSHVQPLDAGIIAAFKQHYRMQLVRWYLNEYETAGDDVNLTKLYPGVRQAILWSVASMQLITEQTIRNCWKKTGILPPTMSASIANNDERQRSRDHSLATELSALIGNLNLGSDALCAEDFATNFPGENEVSNKTHLLVLRLAYINSALPYMQCTCLGGARFVHRRPHRHGDRFSWK